MSSDVKRGCAAPLPLAIGVLPLAGAAVLPLPTAGAGLDVD